MNKKIIEYLIIATAIILLIYGGFAIAGYKYMEKESNVTDSITLYHPSSSGYAVKGDNAEFKNELYKFYDMDVSKLNSSDEKLTNLLYHFANLNQGTIDYLNETCYLITMEFEDGSGFKYHSMIIPYDSFNKTDLSFTKDTDVYLFEANNREFVVDTAFNSRVVT
ncbi:hypothetical protein [Methanobrevibacter sp. UBA212]|uniref:hypothetical protein n=1 Tax=Methanobrevibacter sp. UBA212 TaxID=1915476 RepID=UPI0025D0F54A|nr:hypothetical protein [Methanobrevibacter sp. UBA212]